MRAEKPCGIVFVVSGPSGSGKGSVLTALGLEAEGLAYSVSCTTRRRRKGEVDGVHYHFLKRAEFRRLVAEGAFLEWTQYAGQFYGTPRAPIDRAREEGRDILLEVEVCGAGLVRAKIPDAVLVLLIAPDRPTLVQRLTKREEEAGRSVEDLTPRIEAYEQELSGWSLYDYLVINDELEAAAEDLRSIVRTERLGCRRLDARGYLERHFGAGEVAP